MGENVFNFLKHTHEWEAMEVIAEGQADDLHYETEDRRVWLSRTGVTDGEPYNNKVTIECLDENTYRWEEVFRYPGDNPNQKNIEVINEYLFNIMFDYE